MLEKAVTELKADQAAAISKFNKPDGGFRDRHLYVYCSKWGPANSLPMLTLP